MHVVVAGDDLDTKVARVAADSGVDEARVRNGFLCGGAEQVIDRIGALADLGCVHVQVYFPDSVWGDGMERFAAEVMPAV